jgi:cytosine/adenosine deaminase-related metal-dependent hydrolase
MMKHGCNVAIGTDNVMLNSPDLFRELDYLWKVSKAMENNFISARELVKMVTVNAANILKLDKLGYIDENMLADAVFIDTHSIDLDPMHDPYAAIVHRVNESSIKAVMIGGRFVHGSL